jgi:hypothetical protein
VPLKAARRYGTYACRYCHRALYASQKYNQVGRKRLQASKLRLQLGGFPRYSRVNTFQAQMDTPKNLPTYL